MIEFLFLWLTTKIYSYDYLKHMYDGSAAHQANWKFFQNLGIIFKNLLDLSKNLQDP